MSDDPQLRRSKVAANPPDVIACGAPTTVALCPACIEAYRNGIEPGESACECR